MNRAMPALGSTLHFVSLPSTQNGLELGSLFLAVKIERGSRDRKGGYGKLEKLRLQFTYSCRRLLKQSEPRI